MSVVRLIKPTETAMKFIAANMRDEDLAEVIAAGEEPLEALMNGLNNSSSSVLVVDDDDTPLTVLGVVPVCVLTGSGVPWLLSSKYALQHRKEFLILSPNIVQEMLDMYPRLFNYVHTENKVSIRWLKWMGFKIDSPVTLPNGEQFHRFMMERDYV